MAPTMALNATILMLVIIILGGSFAIGTLGNHLASYIYRNFVKAGGGGGGGGA